MRKKKQIISLSKSNRLNPVLIQSSDRTKFVHTGRFWTPTWEQRADFDDSSGMYGM